MSTLHHKAVAELLPQSDKDEAEDLHVLQEDEEHMHIRGCIDDGRSSQAPPAAASCISSFNHLQAHWWLS